MADPTQTAPRFYITGRQPLRPGALLLAALLAVGVLAAVLYALGHNGKVRLGSDKEEPERSAGSGSGSAPSPDDDKDDPSQIDTIVLGDPADAPVPARKGNHVSPVHPTLLVRLPRYGDQVGLIPNSPAGHLLYDWLAGFNQSSEALLSRALPTVASEAVVAAQMDLRQRTGGFSLLSAKEVQPGLLVFRLRDQTPAAIEFLGTLQVQPDSNPPSIATFSLGAVDPGHKSSVTAVAPE